MLSGRTIGIYILSNLIVIFNFTLFSAGPVSSQSLHVDWSPEGSTHTRFFASGESGGFYSLVYAGNRFTAGERSTGYTPVVDYAVSPDGRFVGLLIRGERSSYHVKVLNRDGSTFLEHRDVIILEASDNSNKLFVHNDASFTIRNNIAGFTLFNPGGVELNRLFNNSGSVRGEAISELRQARNGRSLVVYNPRIVRENGDHSRIQLIGGEGLRHLYTFTEGPMAGLALSENGEQIVALASASSSGLLAVFNPAGEMLRKVEVMQNPERLFLTPAGRHAVVARGNRVELWNLDSGTREASTATRADVVFAHFDEDSSRLIMLTGTQRGRSAELQNPAVYVINTTERSLMREQFDGTLHRDPAHLDLRIRRSGDMNWTILGANRLVSISIH
jgi:hypothetical protein